MKTLLKVFMALVVLGSVGIALVTLVPTRQGGDPSVAAALVLASLVGVGSYGILALVVVAVLKKLGLT